MKRVEESLLRFSYKKYQINKSDYNERQKSNRQITLKNMRNMSKKVPERDDLNRCINGLSTDSDQ